MSRDRKKRTDGKYQKQYEDVAALEDAFNYNPFG